MKNGLKAAEPILPLIFFTGLSLEVHFNTFIAKSCKAFLTALHNQVSVNLHCIHTHFHADMPRILGFKRERSRDNDSETVISARSAKAESVVKSERSVSFVGKMDRYILIVFHWRKFHWNLK